MSRNLCRTDCRFCEGVVKLEEGPRPITEEDAGYYFSEYQGMLVAFASCVDCEAKYLAWLDGSGTRGRSGWPSIRVEDGVILPSDLSHRSTFNDEAGDDDLPKWEMGRVRVGPYVKKGGG